MGDYELKSALQKIQGKRYNFALFKGEKANQVLLGPKPATTKQISALESECGKVTRVVKGVCFRANNETVFATKHFPLPSWVAMTTKIFKENQCSLYLPAVFRQLGDDEADEVLDAEAPGGGVGASPRNTPPEVTSPAQPSSPVADPSRETRAPDPAARSEASVPEPMDAFKTRLGVIAQRLPKATAAQRETAGAKMKSAGAAAAANDFDGANTLLGEAEAILAAGDTEGLAAELVELRSLNSRIKEAVAAANPPAQAALLQAVKAAYAVTNAGALDQARDSLAEVKRLLSAAETGAGAAGASADPKQWTAARATAAAELQALIAAVKKSRDPEGDRVIMILRAVKSNLPAALTSKRELRAVENYLRNDAVVAQAEAPNRFGVKVALRQPLLKVIDALRESLPA